MNDLDAVFRARMRALARRGGAVTKSRVEPNYYREIGRLGGEASVAARKRRIYAEVEYGVCEPATVPTSEPPLQPPSPTPEIKRHLTLADILGEEYLLNLALGPESSRTSRR
jgi:general stress protein YciG